MSVARGADREGNMTKRKLRDRLDDHAIYIGDLMLEIRELNDRLDRLEV